MMGGTHIGTVWAGVELRADRFMAGKQQVTQGMRDLETGLRASSIRIGQTMQGMGRSMSLYLTAPLLALGTAATQTAVRFDGLKRGLTAVEGSATEAERAIKRLNEVAKLPGLGLEEAQQAYIRLRAVKMSGDDAVGMLKAFGNALATVGKGKNELEGVNNQITQMLSKGKVMMQDVRIIQEYVPQLSDAMQRAFGTRNLDAIEKMGIASEEFIRRVTRELAKLPSVSGTAQNSFENLGDSAKRALQSIGDVMLPHITKFIDNTLYPAIERATAAFKRMPTSMQEWAVGIGAGAAGLPLVILGLGKIVELLGRAAGMLKTFGVALLGLRPPAWLLPLLGPAAAVGGVAAVMGGIGRTLQPTPYTFGTPTGTPAEQQARISLYRDQVQRLVRAMQGVNPRDEPTRFNRLKAELQSLQAELARLEATAQKAGTAVSKATGLTPDQQGTLRGMKADIARLTQGKFSGERVSAYNDLLDALAGRPPAEIVKAARERYRATMADINEREREEQKAELDKRLKIYQDYEDQIIDMLEAGDTTFAVNAARRLEEANEALKLMRPIDQSQFGLGGAMGTLRYLRGGGMAGESIQAREARMRRISVPSGGLGAGLNDAFTNMRLLQAVPNLTAPLAGMDAALKQVFDQMPRRFSMDSRISRFKEQLAKSFDFIPDLFSNLADEAYGAFAGTLNRMFGNNPLGRALARTVDRWMSGMLDQALASLFTPSKRGGAMGIMGGEGFPSAGGIPGGIGTILGGGGLGMVLGGPIGAAIGAALGGIFHFQSGGRVPGPVGYPRMAVVHGGEFVLSNRMQAAGATVGGGVSVNIGTVHMASDMDVSRTARQIAWQVRRELRTEISR